MASNKHPGLGFCSTVSHTFVFTKFTSSYTMFVLVYVDDIIITAFLPIEVTNLITTLSSFALKDLGNIHHFLGIPVSRTSIGDITSANNIFYNDILGRLFENQCKQKHNDIFVNI